MFIFFADEPKVSVQTIRAICKRMQDENVKRAILVVQQALTPSAKQTIADIQSSGTDYRIEQFLEAELMVNITEHQFVPEHIVMTADEKQELLNR